MRISLPRPRNPFECAWTAHYTIGSCVRRAGIREMACATDLAAALLYGIGTVVFPFFLMQPSFGLGIAASRTPNPTQARLKSLATHTVFGVGRISVRLV
jgi:hypothetical protein